MLKTIESGGQEGRESMKLLDKVLLSTYVLDFGNVVLNSHPRKRSFKLTNSGQLTLDVIFDSKAFKQAGYTIVPERIPKMPKGAQQVVVVTYNSQKKNTPVLGRTRTVVPMEIKYGPKYHLELLHNLTFPEISIETD